jgi:superfamily I DNA and/or RNA helicase
LRVGTIDSIQGQDAPIVFFAMTRSSGQDVPRGFAFLFYANRLNVAISRAQCITVLVAHARLLDAGCSRQRCAWRRSATEARQRDAPTHPYA